MFEASDDLGGQWHTTAAHSGVWPGMHTNTSRAMTAFSDFAAPAEHPLHPAAEQIHAYLRAYAEHFGVTDRIRLHAPVSRVSPTGAVDGERFDGVIVASGRFRKPRLAPGLDAFRGDVVHAFDYPGAGPYRNRRTLVYGNGISGLEIASELATVTPVISAFRKPRYVIQKVVDGVSSDWQWYTEFGAVERRLLAREEWSRTVRDRVLRVAGNPAAFGAPEPHGDILTAGLSLCQDYLAQVADGSISLPPRDRRDRRPHRHLHRRLVRDRRCDRVRDRLRPRHPLSARGRMGRARRGPRPLPAHAASRPPRLRLHRPVPRAGPVLPAARATGTLDRRDLGRRRRATRRGAHAAHDR